MIAEKNLGDKSDELYGGPLNTDGAYHAFHGSQELKAVRRFSTR